MGRIGAGLWDPKITWPVFSFFPLALLLGFSLLALKERELQNTPKDYAAQSKANGKVT